MIKTKNITKMNNLSDLLEELVEAKIRLLDAEQKLDPNNINAYFRDYLFHEDRDPIIKRWENDVSLKRLYLGQVKTEIDIKYEKNLQK